MDENELSIRIVKEQWGIDLSKKNTDVPIINLSRAPGERLAWGRPAWIVYLWAFCEIVFVTNPFQVSSRVRVAILRGFGARIGQGVIFRPRTRVKFPWKLEIGDNSWIGEGVWIHNQNMVTIGRDVVVSQESFITTGSHAHRKDMALITKPILIGAGTWLTSRCMVLGGSRIGESCLVQPMTVVNGNYPSNSIIGDIPARCVGVRFPEHQCYKSEEI